MFDRNVPLIGDQWISDTSCGRVDHVNPSTGAVQAEVAIGGSREIDAAVRSGQAAQKQWMRMHPDQRRDALLRFSDLVDWNRAFFVQMTALESGIPVSQGDGFVDMALAWGRYYAGWIDKIEGSTFEAYPAGGTGMVRKEPYGVVGAIIPWNSPLVATHMKAIPALAAGNAVVLKPPSMTPFAALKLGELALEAGLPAGLLNVVPGDAEAGKALVCHPDVGKVSFTGGEVVAREVIRNSAETMKPLALELGGKSANMIFSDADLDAAVEFSVTRSCIALTGQGCNLPKRLMVHKDVYEDVVERVDRRVKAITQGIATDPATVMGPVINQSACDMILALSAKALSEGGRLLNGGRRCDGALKDGYFVEPTVFVDVSPDAHLAKQEVFGPVLAVIRFDSDEDAIRIANSTQYGLGGYVHTRDIQRAFKVSGQLKAGYISVNGTAGMTPNAPFGGYKQSGFGREGGPDGLHEFLQTKTVWFAHDPL